MIPYRLLKVIPVFIVMLMLFSVPGAFAVNKIKLDVDISIEQSRISGISRMDVSAGEEVVLMTGPLTIDEIKLNGGPVDYTAGDATIKIMPLVDGEITIKYTGIFKEHGGAHGVDDPRVENIIDERGVSLTNLWYPAYEGLSYYDLRATFPSGYAAISEAEEITKEMKEGKVGYHFRFPYKVDGINLVASDRYTIVRDRFRDIELFAYFLPENAELAKTYIEFTKKYLRMYEDLIGMFPFRSFSIVENFLPTGYSMPTYTLLGSSVVKLPFITETSLGHEILHQWFGNSVYIDYDSGNWAEGLTTYLADHLYREQKGEGWQYRKQILVDYKSYVNTGNDIPLKTFTGRVDRSSRTVGYGKAAMVFHMLKNLVGDEVFYKSLKDVIGGYRFRRASWNDIRTSFEGKYGQDLDWFFTQWIEKEGLPELRLHGVELTQAGVKFKLHFHVDQGDNIFKLQLPMTLHFKDRVQTETIDIEGKEGGFDLTLPDKPRKIVLDENYDVARAISKDEYPPVIARLLGDDKIIIALPEEGKEMYESIITDFQGKGAVSKAVKEITVSDIEANSIIIFGTANPMALRLCGPLAPEEAGFYLIMKDNPWNAEKVIAVFHGKTKDEVDTAFRKVTHYGKYSKLLFSKGVNIAKEIQETKRGIVMDMKPEAAAIEVSSIKTLSDVIKGVEGRRIIYVGEVHDVFAHHAVQLDIITGVYKNDPQIAIGMEMFQRPFQKSLDSFISGETGEAEFLKQTEYFNRWGFDYPLYKPVLDFAKAEKVPVIALNLQKEITAKVSRGGIDSLSEEDKKEIPTDLDFSDMEYRERLKEIFSMHNKSEEKNFEFFYQAQILWDETMSHSVDEFVKNNPGRKIIVLAGQGHLRYGSGIPKRTFRRNGQDYAIVLIDEDVEQGIADYVVFPKTVEGVTTPKLMVFLKAGEGRVTISGFPEKSVSEKAGLKAEDVILFVDDVEVKSVDDIRIYLLYKKTGDIVKVRILRKEEDREKEMLIDVEL
ncbi:MAG: ChaN family lipoprotein [Nitrospirae bacterium]|nr:ChaN family lipoprotein [Nitrospirota bacterium]